MNALLQVKGLEVTYGPVRAVKGVDLEVPKGEGRKREFPKPERREPEVRRRRRRL